MCSKKIVELHKIESGYKKIAKAIAKETYHFNHQGNN